MKKKEEDKEQEGREKGRNRETKRRGKGRKEGSRGKLEESSGGDWGLQERHPGEGSAAASTVTRAHLSSEHS